MDRRDRILSMFDASGFGLEIGPSYNPLLPKSEGFDVETIDYADQAELRRKYAGNTTVDTSRIEPVDYVSDGRSMREVVGAGERYDFIVASHVIEHTPDLVGFLQDCQSLLRPSGVLVLAVPDKRCCFDVFQRLTSTGEVLDAHRVRRSRPGYGAIFDEVASGAKQDGATGWPKGSKGERVLVQTVAAARAIAERSEATGGYTDVHVWRFVPSSFELILADLFETGETALRLARFETLDEFLAVLSRDGAWTTRSRVELLSAALEEHAFEHVQPLRDAQGGLRQALAAREAEIAGLGPSLLAARAEAEALAARLAAEAGEREALAGRLSAAEVRLVAAGEAADALRRSSSWRITAPLRAIVRFLRRDAS